VGSNLCLEHTGAVSCEREALKWMRLPRAGRRSSRKIINLGFWAEFSPGHACALLFVESCGAHAHESDGQGFAPGDAVNAVGAGDDRSGRESGLPRFMRRMAKQTPMQRNGTAQEIACRCAVLCDRSSIYYRADSGGDGGLSLRALGDQQSVRPQGILGRMKVSRPILCARRFLPLLRRALRRHHGGRKATRLKSQLPKVLHEVGGRTAFGPT